jgi:C-terminal processing protease CtpA/Prc
VPRDQDRIRPGPVVSGAWTGAEIEGAIDHDASAIVFGILMQGAGTTWYDDFELAVQNQNGVWIGLPVPNAGFEDAVPLAHWTAGIGKGSRSETVDGWDVAADDRGPASGRSALRVKQSTQILTDELFGESASPGEVAEIDLGSRLRARVPIALYAEGDNTIGDDQAVARRSQQSATQVGPGFDVMAGVADVIVVWNVLEHFWPYWNDVHVDWNAELDVALADALDDRSMDDHVATLERLSAAAPDGHASVTCPGAREYGSAPFAVELVEGEIVVTASLEEAVERGDVIVAVDGQAAGDALLAAEAFVSGSAQWRTVQGLLRFGRGTIGSSLKVRLRRDGADVEVVVGRTDRDTAETPAHASIERFDDGVYYVDLSRTPMAEIDAIMEKLASAPGVVFDVRNRPAGNHQVLSHLLVRPDTASSWFSIPLLERPGEARTGNHAWESSGWNMPPLEPHISGRVAFLTGPVAISYPESVMALVAHYHLGAIVGAATAGTNGNVAQISEPTGCATTFTGMRTTNLDGSRSHLIGVQPTIPASRTIAGVRAGRDEVLEKGLEYVRSGGNGS